MANKALRDIFLTGGGGSRDLGILTKVQQLCWLARSVSDDYCNDKISNVERYAAAIFSDSEHKKLDRAGMTGVEFLRMSILKVLDSHERQIGHLEGVRRAGGADAISSR